MKLKRSRRYTRGDVIEILIVVGIFSAFVAAAFWYFTP